MEPDFSELGLRPRFIICFRNPAHVAASLKAREGLDLQIGELRTLDYLVDALRFTRGNERCFLRYDEWMPDPMPNALKLAQFIGEFGTVDSQEMEIAIRDIVRPEGNRSGRSDANVKQPLVRSFYDLLCRFANSNGADLDLEKRIESFTHSYIAFRQMLRCFEGQFRTPSVARPTSEEKAAQSKNAHEETAAAQEQIAQLLLAAEADRARLAEMEAALAAVRAQAEDAVHVAARHSAWAEELTASKATLEARLTAIETAYEAEKAAAQEKIQQLQLVAEADRGRLVETEAALVALRARAEGAELAATYHSARVEALAASKARLEARLAEIEGRRE